jgi:hypothetical protein
MTDTTNSAASDSVDRTYLDLEQPIREATFMAGIARDLAWELLEGEVRRADDSDVTIHMSKRCHEQLLFALENAHDRALALEKNYHAK